MGAAGGGGRGGGHPAREFFTHHYTQVRASMAAMLRTEFGERLPGGLTPERAAPLLIATMDGLQYQWLLDPEAVDMPAAFQDFLRLLRPDAAQTSRPESADAPEAEGHDPAHD
ncbi:TetR family transcriptional regulator [Streptomyces brevispora]|uniref:TetR family transcriptional regulator n=1 Tax=Streptomyces brevispora TaxID=887462 RepID=A0A561UU51_9ACTN|nr:TetR family transcriptional regulator [Streptomyces brevispora]